MWDEVPRPLLNNLTRRVELKKSHVLVLTDSHILLYDSAILVTPRRSIGLANNRWGRARVQSAHSPPPPHPFFFFLSLPSFYTHISILCLPKYSRHHGHFLNSQFAHTTPDPFRDHLFSRYPHCCGHLGGPFCQPVHFTRRKHHQPALALPVPGQIGPASHIDQEACIIREVAFPAVS